MKILIIRFSSIGDIVLTTPVIRMVKQQIDNSEVHFVTKKQFASVLQANPYIDKLHALDSGLYGLIKRLQAERYDHVVDLHHNLRSLLIKVCLRAPSTSFRKLNLQKWLIVNFKINRLPNKHIVERYAEAVSSLGAAPDDQGLDYFIPEHDIVDAAWLPQGFQSQFVAVVIGAKHATKKLPVARLIELCDKINHPVILLGGPEDASIGTQVEQFFARPAGQDELEQTLNRDFGKKTTVWNSCGKFNINQSASVIQQAMVVFSHDTGLMHIAAAFQKKVYSIWGNTIPEFGMYPYRTKFVIFENKKISCRPCSKIGFDKCPKGHFKCMNELVFDFYIPEQR